MKTAIQEELCENEQKSQGQRVVEIGKKVENAGNEK